MTTPPAPSTREPQPQGRSMALPFPQPGHLVEHAYYELYLAEKGSEAQIRALGDLRLLARPWDPPTCTDPEVRLQVWEWLDDVVGWFNSEYVWDERDLIPPCWPAHPHLVHEIATLADQRRRAGAVLTSDSLEDWHRYAVPAFLERMRSRIAARCDATRHGDGGAPLDDLRSAIRRAHRFAADAAGMCASPHRSRRLRVIEGVVVDVATGEVHQTVDP